MLYWHTCLTKVTPVANAKPTLERDSVITSQVHHRPGHTGIHVAHFQGKQRGYASAQAVAHEYQAPLLPASQQVMFVPYIAPLQNHPYVHHCGL